MRVITFSTVFPNYHTKKGQPTHFVEKIWKSFETIRPDEFAKVVYDGGEKMGYMYADDALYVVDQVQPKFHTIRKGHRWKAGDWFQPVVWSDKPYRSPQIKFAPPMQVKKTWDFEIDINGVIAIGGKYYYEDDLPSYERLAGNDGLNEEDFFRWFVPDWEKFKGFDGQIICWSDKIEY